MNTRIRYSNKNGVLISKDFFPTTSHGSVKVELNTKTLEFSISKLESNELVLSGSSKDLANLKKVAKAGLKSLGVVFALETRNVQKKLKEVGIDYETRASL